MLHKAFLFLSLSLSSTAMAVGNSIVNEYTDVAPQSSERQFSKEYIEYKNQMNKSFKITGGVLKQTRSVTARVQVPGFISTTPIAPTATIIGPNNKDSFLFRVGDTAYMRWSGVTSPKEGDVYSTYTPTVVLQNIDDPTDFIVRSEQQYTSDYPRGYRLAGYVYENKANIKITKVSQGLVTGMVESMISTLSINDLLMPVLPKHNKVIPITGGIQLAAAVVAGSPTSRVSSNEHAFIYINRGARDGMKVGRVFEAIESVQLTTRSIANPESSLGEAMIVYVGDSYSTALITKQFDLIRIGALIKTKQELSPTLPKSMFAINAQKISAPQDNEVPNPKNDMKELPPQAQPDYQTPAPQQEKPLSDLDLLEKNQKVQALSPSEKNRLDKLANQQASKGESSNPVDTTGLNATTVETTAKGTESSDDLEITPEVPQDENSFKKADKPVAKKETKKKKTKKSGSDEEELNMLMMQN